MYDADGKIMAGAMEGAINMIGSYEECYKVQATGWNHTTIKGITYVHDFDAHYCRSYWFVVGTH